MRLLIPTNFDDSLPLTLKEYSDQITFFGKAPTEIIGGGRSSLFLPHVEDEKIEEHIKLIKKLGFKFNYLMNATCIGNVENLKDLRSELRKRIEWIGQLEIDEITISNSTLISIIREILPHIRINTGFGINVDSLRKSKEFEKMGVDGLTLSVDLNRNFSKLKNIIDNSNLRIVLLATLTCFPSCHKLSSCMNSLSHTSNNELIGQNDIPINYPLLSCFFEKLNNPWKILTTPFIRPEDIHHYEKLGVSEIKLTDRFNSTETLIKKTKAYLDRSYDGNLLDLLSFYLLTKESSFKKRKLYIPKDKVLGIIDIEKRLKLSSTPELYIDNKKLDGFLDFFIKNNIDCTDRLCDKCNWCKNFSENSIKFNKDEIDNFYNNFVKFNKDYISLNKI
jgi:collagenase-like PrtC family protease